MSSLSTKAKLTMAILGVGVVVGWVMVMRGERGPGSQPMPNGSTGTERREQIERRLAELDQRRDAQLESGVDVQLESGVELRGRVRQQPADVDVRSSRRRVAEAPEQAAAESHMDADDRAEFERLKHIALTDSDPKQRANAVWQITNYDDAPVVPVLQQALLDSDREVRLAAVQELSGLDQGTPLELVALALDDPDPEVRLEALNVVDEMADEDGQEERVRTLMDKALSDPDEDVRSKAEDMMDVDSDSGTN